MEQQIATFPDSDDESLLLDDHNTDVTRCLKCKGTGSIRNQPFNWVSQKVVLNNENLEDSPLLDEDRSDSFGHLTVKDFHCHSFLTGNADENNGALKMLCTVLVICFLFMLTEIIGGYIAGSLAVMTDAAHLFSDVIGFLVSIIAIFIGRRQKTHWMTFGYHRVEVLGALLSVLFIWLLAATFSVLALRRIVQCDLTIDADAMIIVAAMGLVFNLIMGAILHGTCTNNRHSHSGNHSHSHDNINVRAAAAHIIGDLLQSLGVLVAAIAIKLFPSAAIADPMCTILFSAVVVAVTFKVAKDSVLILIEASPSNSFHILNCLRDINGVMQVHSLKIWTLAPSKEAVAVHLAIDDDCDREIILNQATSVLKRKLQLVSCTIQVESYDSEQISFCSECQELQF